MSQPSQWSSLLAALGLLAGLSGCGDDDGTDSSTNPSTPSTPANPSGGGTNASGGGTNPSGGASKDALVILAERKSPEGSFHYLHVLPDWPADGKLDFAKAAELGEPGVAHVDGDALHFWQGKLSTFRKITIDDQRNVQIDPANKIAFSDYGIMEYDAEPIYVSPELAFLVDEASGQVVRFNPALPKIEQAFPIDPAVLKRDGLKGQFQLGLASNGRLYTTANWYNYQGKGLQGTAIGVFDQSNPAGGPRIVEDARCAPAVGTGVWEAGDYVYIASDSANGFAVLADPVRKNAYPQCVLRVRKDATAFDQDYLVDLQQVTGSPAIRMSWPMKDDKLLVNLWAPQVPPPTIGPGQDNLFWEATSWTYAVVDLAARTSKLITSIQPAKSESSKLLKVDDQNYLQVYRADRSSIVYRVNPDATVAQVLDLPTGADVQFLGRLKPAAKAK